jgi:hypothetical protein
MMAPAHAQPVIQCEPQQQLIQALRREIRVLRDDLAVLRQRRGSARAEAGPGDDISAGERLARAAVHARLGSGCVARGFCILNSRSDPGQNGALQPMARELMQMRLLLQQCMQDNESMLCASLSAPPPCCT